ncbi:MAG: HPF/RaiA family ribosome-associated protein, partial [Candidatus Rokubacteria bacterium]|nr:HPF/RaiA family ribosome-associated protein [Candidatus Rokubacteria bacterium]
RVIWSARGTVLPAAFKGLVERKLDRLGRRLPAVLDARVVCSAEKFRRTARLVLRSRRRTFTGEATAGDLRTAVDEAIEAIRHQVRTDKGRHRPRKGRPPQPAVAGVVETVSAAPALVPQRLVAKPMSVEEAVMQLGLRDDQFLVFRNAETSDVNVLYRKRNGALGLIEPVV